MTARRAPAVNRDVLEQMLVEGTTALDLTLTDAQLNQLLDYVALLGKRNAVYNPTAIRDPKQMLIQHILDSLPSSRICAAVHRPACSTSVRAAGCPVSCWRSSSRIGRSR